MTDMLGNWSEVSEVDPTTHVSKDLTDVDIISVVLKRTAEGQGQPDDNDGTEGGCSGVQGRSKFFPCLPVEQS